MGLRAALRRRPSKDIVYALAQVERKGFEYGIPDTGIGEYDQGIGNAGPADRRTTLKTMYDAYVACPWAFSAVNAIVRTITAGGLVTDWDSDTGQGDQPQPVKPANVLALERMLAWCNQRDDIRQVMRGAIVDLLVYGDAYLELVWVGDQPVALYNLDCPSIYPVADAHGHISGYVQVTEYGQRASFETREVIHIPYDSLRTGVFGLSPTQAAMLPITCWLFAAGNSKQVFRRGNPPTVHVDMPAGMSSSDVRRWDAMYAQRNLGSDNVGRPIITKGGAHVQELAPARIVDAISFLDQKRDEILAVYGVPPAKGGVIEAGHLGAGTGEAQDRTFRVNTCAPIAEIVLEKLNFHLVRHGFKIDGWRLKFGDIDWRDSKVVEDIRDSRLRNGSWTLNRYRAEIGEPPVPGGDAAVLVDRQNLVLWKDIAVMSEAMVLAKRAPGVAAQDPTISANPAADLNGRLAKPLTGMEESSGDAFENAPPWALAILAGLADLSAALRAIEAVEATAERTPAPV
ncbi:hypothetical protein GCM10009839_14100 [Catenulispora yoronensis]|uniref:Phage portal protein n=1 Tax=Catenulispora yoronensis TaxID=450799 RepID=A0ABP5FAM6_9ACTN